jgi:hypothetical protein
MSLPPRILFYLHLKIYDKCKEEDAMGYGIMDNISPHNNGFINTLYYFINLKECFFNGHNRLNNYENYNAPPTLKAVIVVLKTGINGIRLNPPFFKSTHYDQQSDILYLQNTWLHSKK